MYTGRADMEAWQFVQNRSRLWCWARLDHQGRVLVEGAQGFASRTDCIADAMRHGYLTQSSFAGGAPFAVGLPYPDRRRYRAIT
jgi:hypothetical protein